MSVNDLSDREERPAYVRFEQRPIEDAQATREAGHIVYKDMDYVLVTPPYSKDCFESKYERWMKSVEQNVKSGRTPQAWMEHWKESYRHWKQGLEMPLNGTSVKNWSAITPAQVKTIIASGILTIEDLALANDEGVRRLGMGGRDLVNKAMAYVKASKDTGPLVMENASLKKQVEILEGSVTSLTEKLDIVSGRLSSMQAQPLTEVFNEAHNSITAADIIDPAPVMAPEQPVKNHVPEGFGKKAVQDPILVEAYIKRFGKKPHHMAKDASIKAKLEE